MLLKITPEWLQLVLVEVFAGAAEIGSFGTGLGRPYTVNRPHGLVVWEGASVLLVPLLPLHARSYWPALGEEQEVPVFTSSWKTPVTTSLILKHSSD